jgi:hypothetical protein
MRRTISAMPIEKSSRMVTRISFTFPALSGME